MTEFTDKEIIECLRSRQSYVVRYLSDRYLPMIRLMVTQMGGTTEDAKDIFQDGLVIMLEKIDSNSFILTCKFKTFLYSVCENLWKSVLEKRRSAANYFNRRIESTPDHDFTEVYDNQFYENVFKEVYETLDPICQKILMLYWQDYSQIEIAEKLGYTYGYVRKKKCECQAALLKRINNHPDFRQMKQSDVKILQVVCE
jgi:RNA polymerase sigma factor (sigma-70 family)